MGGSNGPSLLDYVINEQLINQFKSITSGDQE